MFDWIQKLLSPKKTSPYMTETQAPAPPPSPEAVEALHALAQPAITYKVSDAPSTTYTGGNPNLGKDFIWPQKNGKPLNFLAQVDLHQVAFHIPNSPLPKSGILSFFYDHDSEQVWGFDPKDFGAWVVIHSEPLGPTPVPSNVRRFSTVNLSPAPFLCYPDSQSMRLEGIPNFDSLEPHWDDLVPELDYPELQLLGYPAPVQNDDMEEECALASAGISPLDSNLFKSPNALAAKATALDWILLAQFNSSDHSEIMFGDCGMLYFWIKKQDLEAQVFDRTWIVLQCF